jgi:hypothetical protein
MSTNPTNRHHVAVAAATAATIAGALALAVVVPASAADAPAPAASAAAPPTPSVTTSGLNPRQQAAVDNAVAWYEEVGLELPAITIRGGDRHLDCHDHDGLYIWDPTGAEIRLCTKPGPWEQRVVLHELAHAWVAEHVSDAERDAFEELRDYESWNDGDSRWEDRGIEQAAEIVAWGVSATPQPVVRLDQDSCSELRAAYVTLTGLEPRFQEHQLCDPVVEARTRN